jgi:hypothetical protein
VFFFWGDGLYIFCVVGGVFGLFYYVGFGSVFGSCKLLGFNLGRVFLWLV